MKVKIECSAKSCTHNIDQGCSLEKLLINGDRAETSLQTSCGNFLTSSKLFPDVEFGRDFTPAKNALIYCKADECAHNTFGNCTAHSIKVQGASKFNNGTNCSSFVKDI